MRFSPRALALVIVLVPALAAAQEGGNLALNMGRGLDNGMSLGWTFKENWTLRPTLGLRYSDQTGFSASVGGTVLRSIGLSERIYAYVGAGAYYASGQGGYIPTPATEPRSGSGSMPNQVGGIEVRSYPDIVYLTAPVGLRGRVYGGFELFAEAAYQRTLSGEFSPNQSGQFSGTPTARFGATFGISLRM